MSRLAVNAHLAARLLIVLLLLLLAAPFFVLMLLGEVGRIYLGGMFTFIGETRRLAEAAEPGQTK